MAPLGREVGLSGAGPGGALMRALRWGAALAALGAGAALLWWAWLPAPLPARFASEDCRRLALTDAETGRAITGIEDIARLGAGTLILSAYDRLAAEAAIARGETPPDGGLYALPPDRLAGVGPLHLAPLIGADAGGLHPHGLSAAGSTAHVVNRRLADGGGARAEILTLEHSGAGWVVAARHAPAGLCAANDLAGGPGDPAGALVTLDRADCPGLSARDALWPDGGRLAALDAAGELTPLVTGLAHPNGLLPGRDGPIIAETRARRLRLPDGRAIALPGGPDNLSRDGDRIIAALHPSLIRLALYRHGWAGHAPSRIVRIGPVGREGEIEILIDDPGGRLFSAATIGVMLGDRLVAGSVRDAGLMVCGGAQ